MVLGGGVDVLVDVVGSAVLLVLVVVESVGSEVVVTVVVASSVPDVVGSAVTVP